MKLNLEIYDSLCSAKKFEINGIDADTDDFGNKFDAEKETAEEYCCGNMVFEIKSATNDVLIKYNITKEEYYEIANKLYIALSFGQCCWCQ